MNDLEFFLLMVYIDIIDENRKLLLYRKLDEIVNKKSNKPVLIIEDFNGLVGFLGNQPYIGYPKNIDVH